MARLITDAGGYYLWADDRSSGGLTLSLESVWSRAADAQIWINPGMARDLAGLKAQDPRLSSMKAFSTGSVWANDRRSLPSGANDWYEGAVFRPDLVLKDLRAIITGKADPGALFYFRKLE